MDHASSIAMEGHLFAITEKLSLSEHHFAFAMGAAVDSLPHNANLYTWRKLSSDLCPICFKLGQQRRQTLAHVLSHCQAALQHGRYNTRHDRVLQILYNHMLENVPKGTTVVVDLDE